MNQLIAFITRLRWWLVMKLNGWIAIDHPSGYCERCGQREYVTWKIARYDTRSGKPVTYEGMRRCECCGLKTSRELNEYEWLHRNDPVTVEEDYS